MKWIVCWTLGLVSRQTPDWICACQKGFLRSSTWDSPLPFWLYCTASFYICQVFLCDHPKIFGCAAPSMYRRTAPPGPSAPEKQQQDQPVDDGGTDAENQHRPRHREQLGPGAGDHTLAFELQGGRDHGVGKAGDGTRVPAPARLASLSNSPSPVSRAAAKIRVMDTALPASSRPMPAFR